MKRKSVQTITFPILVSIAGNESLLDATDWQSFLPSLEASMFVREITGKDVLKWFKTEMSPEEQNLLIGINLLKTALDDSDGDAYTLALAYERLGAPAPEDKVLHLAGKNGLKISMHLANKWLAANEKY